MWLAWGLVKRIARIIGVLGGVGAILWAMRDRLVSVAIPREPQPPALRASDRPVRPPVDQKPPATAKQDEEPPPAQSVTDVTGIGPVYATRLEAAGIATLSDLAQHGAETVAEAAEVPVSRAAGWIESAQALVES